MSEIEDPHREFLRDLRNNPNNLSFWFPKVKHCGFRVPKTVIVPIPDELVGAFFMEEDTDADAIRSFVHESVMPALKQIDGLPFIKNGTFSNKFEFGDCCPHDAEEETIFRSIRDIQYESLCLDTDGACEIVLRERIPSPENAPRIYGGMPLNTELRVFYDFTAHKALYVNNYWDEDYCRESISRSEKDAVEYDRAYDGILKKYKEVAGGILDECEKRLRSVEGLKGIWSVDFLVDSEGAVWLIDMALGHQSVYWNPVKAIRCRIGEKANAFIASQGLPVEDVEEEFSMYRKGLENRYELDFDINFFTAYNRFYQDKFCASTIELAAAELPASQEKDKLLRLAEELHKTIEDADLDTPGGRRKYDYAKLQERSVNNILMAASAESFLRKL